MEVDVGGEEIRMSVMGSRERVPVQSKQLMAAPGKLLSTLLSKQRTAVGGANPSGPLQPKKLRVWGVYFIFIYYHNTDYKFQNLFE